MLLAVVLAAGLIIAAGCEKPPAKKGAKSDKDAKKTTTPDKTKADKAKPDDTKPDDNPLAKPLKKAQLLAELPDEWNTPDGMCLLPNNNVLVSVPNVMDESHPAVLIKVTPDNKVEPYYTMPLHPVTKKGYPFGICVDPEGKNLYIADLQWFADKTKVTYNSRVLRVPLDEDFEVAKGEDGKPVEPFVLVEGMTVANAVIVRDGFLYVTDTTMVEGSDPLISGVYKIPLDKEETIKLTRPLEKDPHTIATIESHNMKIGFGADGLTFDSKGNLYIGNFADGTVHKLEFDEDGEVSSNTIFAKVPYMRSADGIFCDTKTDKIYVADSLANAVQIVNPDGTVQTLAKDEENDGSGGRLDQPSEVLLRGREIIVANIDFPVPGGVNQTYDKPHTLSIIKLDE